MERFKQSAIALIFIALVIGAVALALDSFQDSIQDDEACANTSQIFNTTTSLCHDTTNYSVQHGLNYQYNVSQEGLEGISNATSYISTIGTLIGVAALIAIVVGAFMFIRR